MRTVNYIGLRETFSIVCVNIDCRFNRNLDYNWFLRHVNYELDHHITKRTTWHDFDTFTSHILYR